MDEMASLTGRQNTILSPEEKAELARRYWRIKGLGTIEGLAEEYGVSKQTVINIATDPRYKPEEKETPTGQGEGSSTSDEAVAIADPNCSTVPDAEGNGTKEGS